MVSMMIVGRFSGRIDARLMMLLGAVLMSYSLWEMTKFDLAMDYWPVVITGALQGFGMGFLFVPLSTMAFATIAPNLRPDATSVFSLVRNLGQGIGISLVSAVLSSMMQVNHAELAARLTATSQAVQTQFPQLLTGNAQVLAMANGLVQQQSAILSYLDDFWLMMILSIASIPSSSCSAAPRNPARPRARNSKPSNGRTRWGNRGGLRAPSLGRSRRCNPHQPAPSPLRGEGGTVLGSMAEASTGPHLPLDGGGKRSLARGALAKLGGGAGSVPPGCPLPHIPPPRPSPQGGGRPAVLASISPPTGCHPSHLKSLRGEI